LEFKPETTTAESVKHILITPRLIIHGKDKMGRPCLIIRPRYHKPGEFSTEDMTRYGVFMVERCIRLAEE
jgi:hypothetical protein